MYYSFGVLYFVGFVGVKYVDKFDLLDNSVEFINYLGCVFWGDIWICFNSNGIMMVWNMMSNGCMIVNLMLFVGINCGVVSSYVLISVLDLWFNVG